MKKHIIWTMALVIAAQVIWAAEVTAPGQIAEYWASADGKAGSALWTAVSSATNKGFSTLGYNGLWAAYAKTDVYPTDPDHPDYVEGRGGKIWDMYGECVFTYSNDQCGTYHKVCDCYNREHSIPKSWFGGSTSGIGCDIFHLVPTDGKINGTRSNDEFGEVSGNKDYYGNGTGTAGSWSTDKKTIATEAGEVINGEGRVFEPMDQYKGDFARGYMGTIIKWQLSGMTTENSFFSGVYDAAHYFGFTKKAVVLMMKWHREDPVSQKEIDRNNGIQATQGNRNPFIDYPYLAEYIWGEKAGETVNMSMLMPSTDSEFVPGQSNGWRGGGTDDPVDPDPEEPVTKYGVTWSANGEVLLTDSVEENKTVSALPEAPQSCSAESTEFMGWSNALIAGTTDDEPAVLFKKATDIPAVTEDVTYYAVFAQATAAGDWVPASYTYSIDNPTESWTNTAPNKGGFWLLESGKVITSPVIDLMGLSKITVTMRTYGGSQYNMLDIHEESGKLTSIEATEGKTLTEYSWENNLYIAGNSALTFSSSYGEGQGIGISSITIDVASAMVHYNRYITNCQGTTEVVAIPTEEAARKVLIGNQLYIFVGEELYTLQGQRVR